MKNARTGNNSSRTSNQKETSEHTKEMPNTQNERVVEVLYQKMGDRWFAFSLIDDEVFVGSIPQSEIDKSVSKKARVKKIAGNS
jgi:ribosomal protein L20A (L18A)